MLLSSLLPKLGITLGNDQITTFLSVLFTIGGGIYAAYQRYQKGDVTVFGRRI